MKRETKETKVEVSINLDGTGVCSSHSQIPFLDHMLDVSNPSLQGASGSCIQIQTYWCCLIHNGDNGAHLVR